MNKYMKIAKEMSIKGLKNNEGGPFGAIITDKEGNIIAEGNNRVLCDLDPTAHAEICTIREACKKLKTYDLNNYILYTSCEPCPMCLSAIIWSNIKEVYYGCTKEDAGNISLYFWYRLFSNSFVSIFINCIYNLSPIFVKSLFIF